MGVSFATKWSRLQLTRELAKYVAPPPEAIHDEYLASHVESTVNSDDFSYTIYFHNFAVSLQLLSCVCMACSVLCSECCVLCVELCKLAR